YLQNATDPVVWWSPQLLYQEPAWLEESRGSGVSGAMRWYPLVTFWQVTVDTVTSTTVPPGHGHNYRESIADAWAAMLDPPGWTDGDTARLRSVVTRECDPRARADIPPGLASGHSFGSESTSSARSIQPSPSTSYMRTAHRPSPSRSYSAQSTRPSASTSWPMKSTRPSPSSPTWVSTPPPRAPRSVSGSHTPSPPASTPVAYPIRPGAA